MNRLIGRPSFVGVYRNGHCAFPQRDGVVVTTRTITLEPGRISFERLQSPRAVVFRTVGNEQ